MSPLLRRLALVVVLAAAIGAVPVGVGASASCPRRTTEGAWSVLVPHAGVLGGPITGFDVAWADADVLLVTDGRSVVGSTDGGCTWVERWSPATPPVPGVPDALAETRPWLDQARIVQVVADPSGDPERFSFVLHSARTPASSGATLLFSDDGGRTVRAPTVPPAPPSDRAWNRPCSPQAACRMDHARGDADVLFLTAAPGPIAPGALWRSEDRGDTWEAVATSVGRGDPWDTTFRGIAPAVSSPADADLLHAGVGCRTVERSSDGGRTWAPLDVPLSEGGMPVAVAVSHPVDVPALAVAQHQGYCIGASLEAVHLSRDGGVTWSTAEVVGEDIDGLALDRSGRVAAVTDETGAAWVVHGAGHVTALEAPGGRPLHQPTALGDRDGAIAFGTPDGIVVLGVDLGDPAPPAHRRIPEIGDLGACPDGGAPTGPPTPDPSLRLGGADVALAPGATVSLPVSFELPPGPAQVDVFAVLDASGSMEGAIESLARTVGSAGDALAEESIDLHLGLAEFRSRNTVAYRRLLPVGPIDCRAARALATITPDGADETHLIALEQAVTGRGLPELGVPPGRGATFRPGALHLVVHATDEPFTEGQPHDPALADVAAAFRAVRAEHVGIRVLTEAPVDTSPTGLDETREGLDRLGLDVGTVAPPGGIDCDGDGLSDLAEGEPVTCPFGTASGEVHGWGLGDVLAQIVRGLLRPVEVAIEVEGANGVTVESTVPTGTTDPRRGLTLDGDLVVRCPEEVTLAEVAVRATVDGRTVAQRPLGVRCTAEAEARSGSPARTSEVGVPGPVPGAPVAPLPPPAAIGGPGTAHVGSAAASSTSASASAPAAGSAVVPGPAEGAERSGATVPARRRDEPSPVVPIGAGLLTTATAVIHARTRPRGEEQRV